MTLDYTEWDDGAAELLTVPPLSGATETLIRGPVVLLGWSLSNTGAGSAKFTTQDGGGQIGPAAQITNGQINNVSLGDRGVKFHTELVVIVGSGGTISGCLFIREATRQKDRDRESQSTP